VLIASGIIVLALIAGLICNRFRRVRRTSTDERLSISDLISPLETLAVLILAFVLVGAADSFGDAEDAAAREALMVDQLFETGDYAPIAYRESLQAATVCYARAVRHYSWPAMQHGTETSVPSTWTAQLRANFRQLAASTDNDVLLELLVDTDRDRAQARQARLSESTPAIPGVLYWLMASTLALTVAAYAYSVRLHGSRGQVASVVVLTALFVSSMLVISDVDSPYSGPIRVEPTAIIITEKDIAEEFAARYGADHLPCDAKGSRSRA
jgi:hypothetical protein